MNNSLLKRERLIQLQVNITELELEVKNLKEELLQSETWLSIQSTSMKLNQLKEQENTLCNELHKERLESLYEVRTGYKITSLYLSGDGDDSNMINYYSYVLVQKEAPNILEVECWFDSGGDYCDRVTWEGEIDKTVDDSRILCFNYTQDYIWENGLRWLKKEVVTSSHPYTVCISNVIFPIRKY